MSSSPTPEFISAEILYSTGPEHWESSQHCHDWHELNVVLQPPYMVAVDGTTYQGEIGSVFIVPAGTKHEPTVSLRGNTIIGNVRWRGPVTEGLAWKHFVDSSGRWMMAVRWITDLFQRSTPDSSELAMNLLRCLLAELDGSEVTQATNLANRVYCYLQHHMAQPISMTELATYCNCSPQHLARMFKQRFNCTPMQALRSMRCERAWNLAAASDMSLEEIAQHCGFADAKQLAHVIKRESGRTLRSR